MSSFIVCCLILSGCLSDIGDEEKPEFGKQDLWDWTHINSDAREISVFEAIDILLNHINEIYPGGNITDFGATESTGKGSNRETGKCQGWQFYLLRYVGGHSKSRIVNIAEFGWAEVIAEHDVADIYPEWKYENATIDSTSLPSIAMDHDDVKSFVNDHPDYVMDIQSYHGPPIESDEESYLVMYTGGDDELNVYISAQDGRIIEVKNPNDWSWFE